MNYLHAALVGAIAGIITGYLVYIANATRSCAYIDSYAIAMITTTYLMGAIMGIFLMLLLNMAIVLYERR